MYADTYALEADEGWEYICGIINFQKLRRVDDVCRIINYVLEADDGWQCILDN